MKKILTILLVILLLLPSLTTVVTAAFSELSGFNPFSSYDRLRENAISGSVDISKEKSADNLYADFLGEKDYGDAERYIVRFKDDVSFTKIYEAVSDTCGFELLAASSERLFLVYLDNEAVFTGSYGSIIKYIEADTSRTLEAFNDTYYNRQWQYRQYDFEAIWAMTQGSTEITVAVLDSGVNRSHEDLINANILQGYNAVASAVGVSTDALGHGTAVTGIIAATQNNGKGVAGICPGVSVLPILITRSNGDIFSAEFIRAVYFAADSGADIINMSFGGTDKLSSEQDAITYAYGKGCILIGAAGNYSQTSGEHEEYFYPASYDHVISVASFGETGSLSGFSRYNDQVDIAAPGENIYVIHSATNTAVISENGTSFSAPFVSAVAALALSVKNSGVSINSDYFAALIKATAIVDSSIECGIINPLEMMKKINDPIVSGITDGGVYFKNVTINYNLGSATLDGEPFSSGSTVRVNGSHTLVLTYGTTVSEYSFITDNLPLTFRCADGDSFSSPFSITFTRGTATLNGVPYYSGKTISESGYYSFILTGPYGNTATKSFTLYTDLPKLYGVSNGGSYNTAVELKIIGDGTASVGTKTIKAGETLLISDSGQYTVTLRNIGGTQSQAISFTVNNTPTAATTLGVLDAGMFLDSVSSSLVVYGASLNGIRVYDADSPSSMLRFIQTNNKPVLAHASAGSSLFLMHSDSISVMDTTKLKSGEPLRGTFISTGTFTAVSSDGNSFYALLNTSGKTELVRLNIGTFSIERLREVADGADSLVFDSDRNEFIISVTTAASEVYTCSPTGTAYTRRGSFPKGRPYLAGNTICVGSYIYNKSFVRIAVIPEAYGTVIGAQGAFYYTSEYLLNAADGQPAGRLPDTVASLSVGADMNAYMINSATELIYYKNTSSVSYPTALRCAALSVSVLGNISSASVYSSHITLPAGLDIIDWSYDSVLDRIFLITESSNYLYIISGDFTAEQSIWLNEQPTALNYDGSRLTVAFKNSARLYVQTASDEKYISLAYEISPSMLVGSGTTLFCLNNSNLYSINTNSGSVTAVTSGKSGTSIGYSSSNSMLYLVTKSGNKYVLERYNAISYTRLGYDDCTEAVLPIICDEQYVYVGNSYYGIDSLSKAGVLSGDIHALRGDFALLPSGIYDIRTKTMASTSSLNMEKMIFTDKYEVFGYISGMLVKLNNPSGYLPSSRADITFSGTNISENIYEGSVRINYSMGYGYLDGYSITSGSSVTSGGSHILTVVLPFGNTQTVSFAVVPVMSGISVSGASSINVNGRATLNVAFLPSGVSSIPVVYSASNNNVYVDKNGVVYGLKEGSTTITVSTEDGRFYSTHRMTVAPYTLTFTNSRFRLSSDGSTIINIIAGTTARSFLEYVNYGTGSAEIITQDNTVLGGSDIIKTGDRLVVKNSSGTVLEKQLAVKGDANGDGYISPVDLVLICRHIITKNLSGAELYAADTTLDGKVNLSDLLLVRSHLTKENQLTTQATVIGESQFGSAEICVNDIALPGKTITVGINLYDTSAQAFSGVLEYNPDILEFISIDDTDIKWVTALNQDTGKLYFTTYDETLKAPLTQATEVFTLTFKINEDTPSGTDLEFILSSLMSDSGSIGDASASLSISSTGRESLLSSIVINGVDNALLFSPTTLVYRFTVPNHLEELDLEAICPNEKASVTVSDRKLTAGTITHITIQVDAGGGDITVYSLFVYREDDTGKLSNENRLSIIIVTGGTLSEEFSSNIYDYEIIAADGELFIDASPLDDSASVEIVKTQLGYRITCTAEDGSIAVYELTVKGSEQSGSSNPAVSSESQSQTQPIGTLTVVAIIVGVLAIAAVIAVILTRRRKNNAKRNSEQ